MLDYYRQNKFSLKETQMSVYFTKNEKQETQEIVVNYELIEIAPDYMTPKMTYLFYKPKNDIKDFESYFFGDEAVQHLVTNDGMGYFAGARLIDGWVETYFYTANSKALRHALKEKLPDSIQHEIGSNNDEEWRFFFEKLTPNKTQKREINNRFVTLDLIDAGDDLSLKHEFEHIFYFHTQSQRDKTKEELIELGHTVAQEYQDDDLEQRFVLITHHKSDAMLETINAFSKQTTFIANKYHATYEGWTTNLATQA
jgi:regulator of RNase E activity RraB